MHKGHPHADMDGSNSQTNGNANHEPHRTTSTFTTHSLTSDTVPDSSTIESSNIIDRSAVEGQGGGWTGSDTAFTGSALGNEGFGGPPGGGDGQGNESGPSRRLASGHRGIGHGAEEVIFITALPEKEGTFLFQHRNYQVASARRNSKVIRRYSDFVWLLDCLHKRYPFRQLPLLPPKRVSSKYNEVKNRTGIDLNAVNGNHIAADNMFLEKRRRGLARFANALVRHPVLSQEQLVVMFLTVPTVDVCHLPSFGQVTD